MRRRRGAILCPVAICCVLGLAGSVVVPASTVDPAGEAPLLELWFSIAAPSEVRDALIRDLGRELARTPLRHRARFLNADETLGDSDLPTALALFEVRFDEVGHLRRPTLDFGHAEDRLSPGWLMHAVLRAAEAVRVRVSVVDGRSSWIGQLVSRSILSLPPGPADRALARGVSAVILRLPRTLEPGAESESGTAPTDASRLLAAVARRLDGLDGQPVFEDEYLVVAGRVWLRRDLYWLCVGLWALLFWRGRSESSKEMWRSGGREFRWVFLVAVLVGPAFGSVLLTLPAAVAAWRPRARWPALVALTPVLLYAIRLAAALLGGSRVTVDAIPAILVAGALAAFAASALGRPDRWLRPK